MDRSDIIAGIVIVLGLGAAFFGLLFIAVILGTVIGALTGWLLSLTFLGDWIVQGFSVFGIEAFGKLTVIGAMLGFVGGFFKASALSKK